LPPGVLAAAERRAQTVGVGADRVLICAEAITEEAYLRALAPAIGTSYEPLDCIPRAACPLRDSELIQASAAGLLPLHIAGRLVWIIAPCHLIPARRLADPHQPLPNWVQSFRLTSSDRLWRFVARHAGHELGRQAVEALAQTRPHLSNAPAPQPWKRLVATGTMTLALVLIALVSVASAAFGLSLCAIFLAAAALRLSSALSRHPDPRRLTRVGDDKLPVYTVICALYREASVVEKLVSAIRALDYPIEKLDVKFVLEVDDDETRRALARLDLGPPFEIVIAPPVGPRTKPKALNVALPLARGAYTVVYDAEDAPEPDQLRRAVGAFRQSDDRLACLQASLTIENAADNWLARGIMAQAPQARRGSNHYLSGGAVGRRAAIAALCETFPFLGLQSQGEGHHALYSGASTFLTWSRRQLDMAHRDAAHG
jgi:hypothetical protein